MSVIEDILNTLLLFKKINKTKAILTIKTRIKYRNRHRHRHNLIYTSISLKGGLATSSSKRLAR